MTQQSTHHKTNNDSKWKDKGKKKPRMIEQARRRTKQLIKKLTNTNIVYIQ